MLIAILAGCEFRESPQPRNEQYFIKYYGDNGDQQGVDLLITDDGGFLILASTDSSSLTTGDRDLVIIKTDELGNEEWRSPVFGTDFDDRAVMIDEIPDGSGYAVLSEVMTAEGVANACITLVSVDGMPGNQKVFTSTFNEVPTYIDAYPQGIVISGTTEDVSNKNIVDEVNEIPVEDVSDFMTYNVDYSLTDVNDLNATWRNWGFTASDIGGTVIFLDDPNAGAGIAGDEIYLNVYSTNTPRPSFTNQALHNINYFTSQDENPLEVSGIVGNQDDQIIKSVSKSPIGDFFYVASSSIDAGISGVYFFKVFPDLVLQENDPSEYFGSSSFEVVNIVARNNDFGLTMVANEIIDGNSDILLSQLTDEGAVVWEASFGFPEFDDYAGDVVELADGSIVLTGTIRLDNQDKICLIKVKPDGTMEP